MNSRSGIEFRRAAWCRSRLRKSAVQERDTPDAPGVCRTRDNSSDRYCIIRRKFPRIHRNAPCTTRRLRKARLTATGGDEGSCMSDVRVRSESAVEYFKELVEGALAHQRIVAGELTAYYVVQLLAGFLERPTEGESDQALA